MKLGDNIKAGAYHQLCCNAKSFGKELKDLCKKYNFQIVHDPAEEMFIIDDGYNSEREQISLAVDNYIKEKSY